MGGEVRAVLLALGLLLAVFLAGAGLVARRYGARGKRAGYHRLEGLGLLLAGLLVAAGAILWYLGFIFGG